MGQDPRAYQSTVRLRVIFTNKIWGVGRKEREKTAEQQRNARVLPARTRVDVRAVLCKGVIYKKPALHPKRHPRTIAGCRRSTGGTTRKRERLRQTRAVAC